MSVFAEPGQRMLHKLLLSSVYSWDFFDNRENPEYHGLILQNFVPIQNMMRCVFCKQNCIKSGPQEVFAQIREDTEKPSEVQ